MIEIKKYLELLSFLDEIGIELTEDQFDKLNSINLGIDNIVIFENTVDRYAHTYEVNAKSPATHALKRADIEYKKLKRGSITEDEYYRNCNKIRNEYINNGKLNEPEKLEMYDKFVDLNDRAQFERYSGPRTTSQGSREINKGIKHALAFQINPANPYEMVANIDSSSLTDLQKKKLTRLIERLLSTDNEHEYDQSFKQFLDLLGISNKNVAIGIRDYNSTIHIIFPGQEILSDGTLYHTSVLNNIQSFKGSKRSNGYMLFPTARVYVAVGYPVYKNGSNADELLTKSAIYVIKDRQSYGILMQDTEYPDKPFAYFTPTGDVMFKQISRTGEKFKM